MIVLLKDYRKEAKLTQEELANRVGVRRETIVFLEQGKYNPSLELALKVAKEVNAKVEDIFSLEN